MSKTMPIFDRDGEQRVQITTDGDTLKPFVNAVSHIVKEARLRADSDGLHIAAVDPSNVVMIDITLSASAFDSYDSVEFTTGVYLKDVKKLIRRARMGENDSLEVTLNENRLRATVARSYGDGDVVTDDTMRVIDPESIRQEPDAPDIRNHEDYEYFDSDVSPVMFSDAASHVVGSNEHMQITSDDGDLIFKPMSTTDIEEVKSAARIEDAGHDTDAIAAFSGDYIEDFVSAVMAAKATDLTVAYADESPVFINFERERDGERIMHGQLMQAPRIRS